RLHGGDGQAPDDAGSADGPSRRPSGVSLVVHESATPETAPVAEIGDGPRPSRFARLVRSRRTRIVAVALVVFALFATASGLAVSFHSQRDDARATSQQLRRSLHVEQDRNTNLAGRLASTQDRLATAQSAETRKNKAITDLDTCVLSLRELLQAEADAMQ